MNFDDAIVAHVRWKVRLTQFIEGLGTEKLESATVCKDNLCTLGKWIYGDGARFKELAGYQDLVRKHANFHVCAAEVVKLVEVGNKAGAKAAVGYKLASASKETVMAINELRREVTAQSE